MVHSLGILSWGYCCLYLIKSWFYNQERRGLAPIRVCHKWLPNVYSRSSSWMTQLRGFPYIDIEQVETQKNRKKVPKIPSFWLHFEEFLLFLIIPEEDEESEQKRCPLIYSLSKLHVLFLETKYYCNHSLGVCCKVSSHLLSATYGPSTIWTLFIWGSTQRNKSFYPPLLLFLPFRKQINMWEGGINSPQGPQQETFLQVSPKELPGDSTGTLVLRPDLTPGFLVNLVSSSFLWSLGKQQEVVPWIQTYFNHGPPTASLPSRLLRKIHHRTTTGRVNSFGYYLAPTPNSEQTRTSLGYSVAELVLVAHHGLLWARVLPCFESNF